MKINSRTLGIVLFIIGIVLLYYGYAGTQSALDKVYRAATGSHRQKTVRYFAGGAAATIGGGLLILFGKKKP